MIPLWYKDRTGKYHALEHFPDGKVGLHAHQLLYLDYKTAGDFSYDAGNDRYLLNFHAYDLACKKAAK